MAIYGVDFLGSEYYGIPKFSNFDATPFTAEPLDYAALRLTWATPSGDWDILRIVRNSYGTPDWEDDGTVIGEYAEPSTNEIFDEDLSGGRFYYYSVFVRETANQRWHRAATALGLTAGDYGNANSFFNWLPGWFREQDNDLGNQSGLRRGDGPLKKYLKVTGLAADFVRTEYESLRWTRDPDRISGNLLPMLANQFGIPHEPALGMRRTRFWARDAVFLYRRKGTLPGIQAIVTTITGWDSVVAYDRNLLKGVNADAWSAHLGTIADDLPNSNFATGDLQTTLTPTTGVGGSWRIATAPEVVDDIAYHATLIEEGILYAATAEFLATATGTVTPRLLWFAADGTALGEAVGDAVDPFAATWVGSYVAGIAPIGAAYVVIRYDGNVATRFRRASLEREEATPGWIPPMALDIALIAVRTNYVTNPSFEYDTRGWVYTGDGSAVTTGEQSYSGMQSLDVSGNTGPAVVTGGPYRISSGDAWHVFSMYFRNSGTSAEVRLRWLNAGGAVIRTGPWSRVFAGSATSWTRAWIADFAPDGAVSGEVDLRLSDSGTAVRDVSGFWHAMVDAVMLESGDYPGEYFDGSRFGADYIWGAESHSSTSRHYPGRTARNARLMEILPDYLPIGQTFNLRFTEEAELGARAAGYGAIGVGGTGRMNLGE